MPFFCLPYVVILWHKTSNVFIFTTAYKKIYADMIILILERSNFRQGNIYCIVAPSFSKLQLDYEANFFSW
jgi:hypothetical protein